MNTQGPDGRHKRVLAKRLAVANVCINLLVTAIITAWMLLGSYRSEVNATRQRLDEIGRTIVPGLVDSLWQVDPHGIDDRLDEIGNIPGVEYVRLQSKEELHERGRPDAHPRTARSYPLIYNDHRHFDLGTLTVEFGWDPVRQKLQHQAIEIGIATLSLTFFGTLALLFLVQARMTQSLEIMSGYLRMLRVEYLDIPLILPKSTWNRSPDEIDQMAGSINRMREYLAENVAARIRHEAELQSHHEKLEALVRERTAALEEKTRELELQSHTFEKMANTDALTGACSRRFFIEMSEHVIARCARSKTPLAMLLLDVDHFKSINDVHGHAVGDQVLVGLASTCQAGLREIDLLGRLGGEEFGLLLPEVRISDALAIAERLRSTLASLAIRIPRGDEVRFTVSIGLCMLSDGSDTYETLMAHADSALYGAKEGGRNRVCIFDAATLMVAR
ncbi:GGDEF domain-containing protein [Rhodanobacter sp. DHB23]|uniref:sensor domain-containing diguanylate cyclase n=1 Tax=Rhodanobacter sp. DHB23 TaxID=2775923 RepID=UPI0017821AF3|nr:GGDEF domain-containing protein [Rhodanobacter sp. DHB23]MBD8872301.1 diguanylate cyclase [Rhodanobacter sp. DHB23]